MAIGTERQRPNRPAREARFRSPMKQAGNLDGLGHQGDGTHAANPQASRFGLNFKLRSTVSFFPVNLGGIVGWVPEEMPGKQAGADQGDGRRGNEQEPLWSGPGR